jgi:hypothetical protein
LKKQNISKDSSFSFSKTNSLKKKDNFEIFSISKNNLILCQSSQGIYDNLKTLEKFVLHENATKAGESTTLLIRV